MLVQRDSHMISPCGKYAWINIPKNASSFTKTILETNNWKTCEQEVMYNPDIEKVCILRDPIWRWISGFSQTMLDYQVSGILDMLDNTEFWKVILINPVLDNHTEFQHKFVKGAENLKHIYMQDRDAEFGYIRNANKFYLDLANFIEYTGGKSTITHWTHSINPAENNAYKFKVFEKIRELVKEEYHCILRHSHKLDYLLIDKIEEFCYNKQDTIKEKHND